MISLDKWMNVEDLPHAEREEILDSTNFSFRLPLENRLISLGQHKNDSEVVFHILDNFDRYYYVHDIKVESIVCEESFKRIFVTGEVYTIENLAEKNIVDAITTNFDTANFLYDCIDGMIKTGNVPPNTLREGENFRSCLSRLLPMFEKHLDYVAETYDLPENQECLHYDLVQYDLKVYEANEVWNIIEKRDMYRKLEKSIPLKPLEKETKLKI